MPKYFYQVSNGYRTPADMIAGRKITLRGKIAVRWNRYVRQVEPNLYRIGLLVDFFHV